MHRTRNKCAKSEYSGHMAMLLAFFSLQVTCSIQLKFQAISRWKGKIKLVLEAVQYRSPKS